MRRIASLALSRRSAVGNGVLVFQGDSITAGFGLEAAERWPTICVPLLNKLPASWANVATGGDTVLNMNSNRNEVDSLRTGGSAWGFGTTAAYVVVLAAGTNDLSALGLAQEPAVDAAGVAATLLARIEQFRNDSIAAGWDRVILGSILKRNGYNAWFETARQIVNSGMNEMQNTQTFFANYSNDSLLNDPSAFPDGTHPNAEQTAAIAPYVATAINLAVSM